jgi:hypothetical protein
MVWFGGHIPVELEYEPFGHRSQIVAPASESADEFNIDHHFKSMDILIAG